MQQRPASSPPELTTSHEVPTEVVQEKLDSALLADLGVSPAQPLAVMPTIAIPLTPATPPDPPPAVDLGTVTALVGILLGLFLMRWVGLRWVRVRAAAGSRIPHVLQRRTVPPPRGETPSDTRSPERPERARAVPPKRQDPIPLPPHVAAILARLEQRSTEGTHPPAPQEGSGGRGNADGVGLDIWIGR